ncbi:FAD binding domain-containing protein [Ramlibacter montanisoli]|uniref:Xanthine dehydrogenase family protein subunit M n=1 Tax=Ramlibacter montanisoli TaxID=2732512 RepID=A0A849KDA9_9BURK|nr:xanthine dehydrogenase family protein subunit M [Ramlibacter montanisoli]NNU42985.1 xanthine dehydrogenase family protein subunit M [Ramlibacter montanisoli]
MIPSAFEYHAPTSLPDAIALLGRYGDEAKLLAGGHSLLPMMKLRFAAPAHLIDLGRIPDLRGIDEHGGEVHIGAMTTENDIVWSKLLAEKIPLLVEGARWIADPQVRYRGTIGGDISHGDPANDHPALMLALDASFALRGPGGERIVKAQDFFHGLYATELLPGEVLTRIQVPIPAAGTGWAYEKLKRKIGDFATAAAAVLLALDRGRVARVSIALTNVGATPLRARAAEAALIGRPLDEAALAEAARLAMDICDPVADQRGDADYKRAMAGEMTRRALLKAQSRAA